MNSDVERRAAPSTRDSRGPHGGHPPRLFERRARTSFSTRCWPGTPGAPASPRGTRRAKALGGMSVDCVAKSKE
jgi:hypothetical protein